MASKYWLTTNDCFSRVVETSLLGGNLYTCIFDAMKLISRIVFSTNGDVGSTLRQIGGSTFQQEKMSADEKTYLTKMDVFAVGFGEQPLVFQYLSNWVTCRINDTNPRTCANLNNFVNLLEQLLYLSLGSLSLSCRKILITNA